MNYTTSKTWAKPLNGTELKIKSPHGFGLDKDGNVMITDEGAGRVLRFSATGKYLSEIGQGSGDAPGKFKEPREVRCDSAGNIYVTDSKGDNCAVGPSACVDANDTIFGGTLASALTRE